MATTCDTGSKSQSTDAVRFHISLNVDDLARSVEFFGILFDTRPARLETDYAKFELDEPPLVVSLEPNRAPRGGKLNHLGFRLSSGEALIALQRRLEMHGLATQREEGVECCYSRQTKFWIADPDGNLWELYALQEDLDHRGLGQSPGTTHEIRPTDGPAQTPADAPAIWAHRLGETFPAAVMAESGTVDEVLLQGTFNAEHASARKQPILGEVSRILKAGGRLTLYQLTAKTPLAKLLQPLPGPAAAVQTIPSAAELADEVRAAGFVDLYFDKLGECPCFVADGVECRETRLIASKPMAAADGPTRQVLYKGPFQHVEDDRKNRFVRGQWTAVDLATWKGLQAGAQRDQFVL